MRALFLAALVLVSGPARADLVFEDPRPVEAARMQALYASLPALGKDRECRVFVLSSGAWRITRTLRLGPLDGVHHLNTDGSSDVFLPGGDRWDDAAFAHEFGHHAWGSLTSDQRATWAAFWRGNVERMPHRFGRRNEREGWAWCYQYRATGRALDAKALATLERLLGR